MPDAANEPMPAITLLTGPAACGKNTIAHLYATQFRQRCAVIDNDLVRWMLRKPHLAPMPTDTPDAPAQYQHRLGVKHCCLLAESFIQEGFEVVICDVVSDTLAVYYRSLLAAHDFKIVLLLPTWAESLRRLNARSPTITEAEAHLFYAQQARFRLMICGWTIPRCRQNRPPGGWQRGGAGSRGRSSTCPGD